VTGERGGRKTRVSGALNTFWLVLLTGKGGGLGRTDRGGREEGLE